MTKNFLKAVCPRCGQPVLRTMVKMYPGGNMGNANFCHDHGLLFEWQLWEESDWLIKRKLDLEKEARKHVPVR